MTKKSYKTFKDFYPFYLSQHQNPVCKGLHFVGTLISISLFTLAIFGKNYWLIFFCPILGYSFAWSGHFFFEKNKPATFTYPLYSFIGDFALFKDIILGKEKI